MERMKQTSIFQSFGGKSRRNAVKINHEKSKENKIICSPVKEITELLSSLKDTPRTFAIGGVLKGSLFPGLNIEGVGPICLPLCCHQAKKIYAVATEAVTGVNDITIVCKNTKDTWSLQPNQFTLENPQFNASLESLVSKVKEQLLGCDSKFVKASLYKLLLYEERGHFKPHHDSEKEDGMFATLIIQLPSVFKGNQLIVRHGGKTKTIEFDVKESEYEMIYAAHYADCQHDMTPLQSGYRLALIYNLVWTASSIPPCVDQNKWTLNRLTFLLPKVVAEHKNVFGFTLEHEYSGSSLQNGIKALKGKDRTKAVSLQAANQKLKGEKFTFYILKVARETIESGEYCGWDRWDYGEYEPGRVLKDTTSLKTAYDFNGNQHDVTSIPFKVENDLLDFKDNYNSDLEKFWGEQEEPSRIKLYNKYVLLVIPESETFRLLCKRNIKDALDLLYNEFTSSSIHFKEHLKTFLNEYQRSDYFAKEEDFIKVVEMLQSTRDAEMIKPFIENVVMFIISLRCHSEKVEASISNLFKIVEWPSIKLTVEKFIAMTPPMQYGRWLNIHSLCGITDICHKVIELILLNIEGKQWSRDKKECTVFVKLFQTVFKSEELSNRWWTEISTCVEITSNINLLAAILAHLPSDSEPNKYTFIIDSFINCLNHAPGLQWNVEKYSPMLFGVIKPIFTNGKFQKHLMYLRNCLVEKKSGPIIGRLLSLLFEHDASWSKMENFQMFFLAFMDWMDEADLDESHSKEVINIAKVLYQQDGCSADDSLRYLTSCQKINNVTLLCSVIIELNDILNKNDVSNRSHIIKVLMNSLLALLSKYNVSQQPKTGVLGVLLIMFKERSDFGDILTRFIAHNYVTSSISLLGGVIKSLCSDKENFDSLKTDLNFQSALVNYIRLFKQQETVDDVSSFSTTLSFLFTDESWCMERCIDLNGLITAGCLQNDFKTCAGVIAQMPTYHSQNYKNLLLVAVKALECSNTIEQGVDYDLILEFLKNLLRDQIACSETILRFTSSNQLKVNDLDNISKGESVLQKLIFDLKYRFCTSQLYETLIKMRIENLQTIEERGPPESTYEQPNANISDYPTVQEFLRSPEQHFEYDKFDSVIKARQWAKKYFGTPKAQISKGYCCSVNTGGTGRHARAVLTKIPFSYKEKKRTYESLMRELRSLVPFTSSTTCSKRQQPMVSATTAKKQAIGIPD